MQVLELLIGRLTDMPDQLNTALTMQARLPASKCVGSVTMHQYLAEVLTDRPQSHGGQSRQLMRELCAGAEHQKHVLQSAMLESHISRPPWHRFVVASGHHVFQRTVRPHCGYGLLSGSSAADQVGHLLLKLLLGAWLLTCPSAAIVCAGTRSNAFSGMRRPYQSY